MRCLVAVAALMLAGCTGALPDPAASQLPGEVCDLVYPDGRTVDCTAASHAADLVLDQAPGLDEGWACVDGGPSGSGDADYTFYKTLQGDRFGVAYDAPALAAPVHGIWLTANDPYHASRLHAFEDADSKGFVSPGPADGPNSVQLHLFHFEPIVNTTRFAGPISLAVSWSLFEGSPWAIYAVTVGNRTFHLEGMGSSHAETLGGGEYDYWTVESAGLFDEQGLIVKVDKTQTFPRFSHGAVDVATYPGCTL